MAPWKERSLTVKLCLAQDDESDRLLSENPFALLVGMVLDQQVPFETAFSGPKKIADAMKNVSVTEKLAPTDAILSVKCPVRSASATSSSQMKGCGMWARAGSEATSAARPIAATVRT